MRALVAYESMYGNTRSVAEAIAKGMVEFGEVQVVPLEQALPEMVGTADLVVVGGPTHVHGISRAATRKAAVEAAQKTEDLALDAGAPGMGMREWLASMPAGSGPAVAFDTRIDAAAWLTGHASKGIARALRKHGFSLLDQPTSFLVTKQNTLVEGEVARAEAWGAQLGTMLRSSRDRLRS